MKVIVKFFARYREIVGSEDVEIEIGDNTTVVGLIAKLVENYHGSFAILNTSILH